LPAFQEVAAVAILKEIKIAFPHVPDGKAGNPAINATPLSHYCLCRVSIMTLLQAITKE
jgi:hypothetical protein